VTVILTIHVLLAKCARMTVHVEPFYLMVVIVWMTATVLVKTGVLDASAKVVQLLNQDLRLLTLLWCLLLTQLSL